MSIKTPAGILIGVALTILLGEFSIMALIGVYSAIFEGEVSSRFWEFFDPIVLTILVSPVLLLLIFKPMRAQQNRLEQQLNELRLFQDLSIGRELRIKDLCEENAALRSQLHGTPDVIPPESAVLKFPQYNTDQQRSEGQSKALLFMLEDLEASRKQLEHAHQEWMIALDVVSDPIFLHDKNGNILRCNKAYQKCADIPFKQIIGKPYYEIFPKNVLVPSSEQLTTNVAEEFEVQVGDSIYRSRAFPIKDAQGDYLYSVHTLEDITERRLAHAALNESEEKFRRVSESALYAVIMMGSDQCISFWNAAAEAIFGYTATEAIGQDLHDLIVPPPSRAKFKEAFPHFRDTGTGPLIGKVIEVTALRKGGIAFPVELSLAATKLKGKWQAISIVRDITERKHTEAAIKHANRALATLGAVNRQLVHADNEEDLLQVICEAIVEQRGYRMAWVGYALPDDHKTIKIMAHAGNEDGYLQSAQLFHALTERGNGPEVGDIRGGVSQLSQDVANDPHYLPWRDAALQCGFKSSISLPLSNKDGTTFGFLTVYSDEVDAFSPNEIDLLEEMAGDMAFGVRTLQLRRERDHALETNQQQLNKLNENLDATIGTIARIVEMRDPYTAGHQSRVADLAAEIARKMDLSEEQIRSIHIAGAVHDLGKIQIPAELLSKPGVISDIEHSLIKMHAKTGYDILKDIDFPWPLAQIVFQHHELMDGTGYPLGLKGDAILLESRIVCVADVVEAMFSHRPYRAGLGMDAALDEITEHRGTKYDPLVVDACLALFREQKFSFKV